MTGSAPDGTCPPSILPVLFRLRTQGISVWADGGRLRYTFLRGAPSPDDIEWLRTQKIRILELLEQTAAQSESQPALAPRLHDNPVPLSFIQRYLWTLLGLDRHSSMRSAAAAARITGSVDLRAWRRSFADLIQRHETLRTRVVTVNGDPFQVIDPAADTPLNYVDFSAMREAVRGVAVEQQIKQLVYEEFDVAQGPVLSARLMKLAPRVHVLAFALDHIISDGASVGIFLREIFALYEHHAWGSPLRLPASPVQFADFAQWQQDVQHLWDLNHAYYWRERLDAARRVRVFPNMRAAGKSVSTWIPRPFKYGRTLSNDLRELPRKEKTTLAMCVFTAYCASLLRWCESSEMIVPFLTRGRHRPELENVIGCFGHPLLLRIELRDTDTFRDLLARITREYNSAYGHDDEGRILCQLPVSDSIWNPGFSWNPQAYGFDHVQMGNSADVERSLKIEQMVFETTVRDGFESDGEPRLDLGDTHTGVEGTFKYRSDLISIGDMERYEQNVRQFAQRFVSDPTACIVRIPVER